MNIPFLFTLTLIWAAAKFIGIDTSITGDSQMIGIILIVLTFGTAFAEFYKSSDLSEKSFALDTGFCLLQVIVGTVVMSLQGLDQITVPDLLLCIAILADGYISPLNSFKNAKRDIMASGDGHDHH